MSMVNRLLFAVLGLVSFVVLAASAQTPGKLTAEKVRQLQTQYQQERAAADKEGLTKKFSPEWYEQAAKLAKQGEDALAAGRLVEARASFRRARWELPAMPPHLPPHVARIFGDGRLRFNGPVLALAYSAEADDWRRPAATALFGSGTLPPATRSVSLPATAELSPHSPSIPMVNPSPRPITPASTSRYGTRPPASSSRASINTGSISTAWPSVPMGNCWPAADWTSICGSTRLPRETSKTFPGTMHSSKPSPLAGTANGSLLSAVIA